MPPIENALTLFARDFIGIALPGMFLGMVVGCLGKSEIFLSLWFYAGLFITIATLFFYPEYALLNDLGTIMLTSGIAAFIIRHFFK